MLDLRAAREYLQSFNFRYLFIEELGWDRFIGRPLQIEAADQTFTLTPVAQKHGVQVFESSPDKDGKMPLHAVRQRIDRQLTKLVREHLIIFTDADDTTQIWQWVHREHGKPAAYREQSYHKGQSGEALLQQLGHIV